MLDRTISSPIEVIFQLIDIYLCAGLMSRFEARLASVESRSPLMIESAFDETKGKLVQAFFGPLIGSTVKVVIRDRCVKGRD